MKDQVLMSKKNGQLVIAVPLFRICESEPVISFEGYTILMSGSHPIAYVLDCGPLGCQLFSRAMVDRNFEFLGEL